MVETRHRQTVLCSLILKEQFAQNLQSCHHLQAQTVLILCLCFETQKEKISSVHAALCHSMKVNGD